MYPRFETRCQRCGSAEYMRAWSELNDEEREVVRRLPASAHYTLDERRALHLWCTRCWYEATSDAPRTI
jgi:hypothetical protein